MKHRVDPRGPQKKAAKKNPNILTEIETQINVTALQIDRLVYENGATP